MKPLVPDGNFPETAKLIIAYQWPGPDPHPEAVQWRCEVCGGVVAVFPSTAAQIEADENFHAVCFPCVNTVRKHREIRFSGRVQWPGHTPWTKNQP